MPTAVLFIIHQWEEVRGQDSESDPVERRLKVMCPRADPRDYDLDCRRCLGTEYFNNSLQAEYSPCPGRVSGT